jgi:predicted  nucleic acid-binding Zn-ribbon protein
MKDACLQGKRKEKPMPDKTLKKLKKKAAFTPNANQWNELLTFLEREIQNLKEEDQELARKIVAVADQSFRGEKSMRTELRRIEVEYPHVTDTVNRICVMLSSLGM